MTCGTEQDALLMQRLNRHPQLRARVERLLGVVEDATGDIIQADAAERRVIEELRHMGQEALTAWAERSLDKSAAEATAEPGIRCGGKKKLHWHTTFGEITVMEPVWRVGTKIERRFREQAGVQCRGYSLPLQRVLTDFGADNPFGRVPLKLKEHYGIEVPVGAIQRLTERHAQACYEQEQARIVLADAAGDGVFIGEMDGSMVPVVEPVPEAPDRRRAKVLAWREVRLCLVHRHGEVTPTFGGHLAGGVEESGRQFKLCAVQAGFGRNSELHAVGDGALWIANQVELQFGRQGRYLLDFYHVSEYLAAASKRCAANAPDAWVDQQELRLKTNQAEDVLDSLAPFLETDETEDSAAPVRACHRYLSNRLDHLDYQGAIERGLPIGSGEIESAHRYLLQERLKGSGMWWTPAHAQAMLALRLKRANGEWNSYWQGVD